MLDPFTTLFMAALTTLTCGLLLLVCCGRDGNSPLLAWAVAMVVAACGLVTSVAGGAAAAVFPNLGVAMLLTASALFWTATRLFRGVPARWDVAAMGGVAWLLTAPLHTDEPAWTAVSCLIGAGYTVASAVELVRMRAQNLPSLLPAILLTVTHAGVYLGRVVLALAQIVAPDTMAAPAWIGVALLTEATIHISGSTIVLVALSRELGERRNSRDLRIAAYQDGLTGLANRRKLDQKLEALAGELRHRDGELGLIMIDLDRFKLVNDTVGHDEGDRILRAVAGIIAANVRPDTDLAARYGGEEFAVVIARTTLDNLALTAERIRAAVQAAAIPHLGTGETVTVSIGIAVVAAAELGPHRRDLFCAADQALYEAKRLGRNRVSCGRPAEGAARMAVPFPARAA